MSDVVQRIREARVVAVLRGLPEAGLGPTVTALREAGMSIIEITLDSEGAERCIAALRARGDVTVLAGTVRTPADAERAAAAGAEACVAPATVRATVERCHELVMPVIPGAFTPSEVEAAWALGPALVKLFPGGVGGPAYVRDLLGPLAGVPLMVTGGVDVSNAAEFLVAGAVAVGAGSSLIGGNPVETAARARALVAAVNGA